MADKLLPDQELAQEILKLFNGYNMVDIGTAMTLVFATFMIRTEIEFRNGETVLPVMLNSFKLMGDSAMDKINKIKNDPVKMQQLQDLIAGLPSEFEDEDFKIFAKQTLN